LQNLCVRSKAHAYLAPRVGQAKVVIVVRSARHSSNWSSGGKELRAVIEGDNHSQRSVGRRPDALSSAQALY